MKVALESLPKDILVHAIADPFLNLQDCFALRCVSKRLRQKMNSLPSFGVHREASVSTALDRDDVKVLKWLFEMRLIHMDQAISLLDLAPSNCLRVRRYLSQFVKQVHPQEVRILKWDLKKSLEVPSNVAVIGSRKSGKARVVRNLLAAIDHSNVLEFDANSDPKILHDFVTSRSTGEDTSRVTVCFNDVAVFSTEQKMLLRNGRHWNVNVIAIIQSARMCSALDAISFDHVILLPEPNPSERRNSYQTFGFMFFRFEDFDMLVNSLNILHRGCLVIRNRIDSTKIKNYLRWYNFGE